MGSVIGKTMEENFKKQQEFMEKNQETMLERQIQMQNQMRERQAAMMLARARDMFHFYSSFYFLCLFGGTIGFLKSRNPKVIAPLVPLSIIFAYQGDLAYGTKMQRCRDEADKILDENPELYALPHGLPTIAQIEAARLKK